MVDEREDGIERLRHEGRVHRWSRPDPQWPGHTAFVALKGGEAVLGDRYAAEGVVRTYACDLRSLLDGCFDAVVGEQLGAGVLEELLAEARRELGEGAATGTPKNLREVAVAGAVAGASKTGARTGAGASTPASEPLPAKVVSAPPRSAQIATNAPERPSVAVSTASSPIAATGPTPEAARVDLVVVACPSVGLPLAVALRGITRAPVQELSRRLRSLPCRVAAGVPREQAQGLAARLAELGAEVRLLPASGS